MSAGRGARRLKIENLNVPSDRSGSCNGNFLSAASLEILELDPHLFLIAHFDRERIQSARRRTGRVLDLAGQSESAVVTGTEVMTAVRQKINKATGMGANDVEGLQLVVGGAPEIDCADGHEVKFVPCIHARGKH